MSDDYAPQAWRFGDGPNQFYADQYATTSTRLDYDLDYDESRFNQHKAEFLADLAAHDAAVAANALREAAGAAGAIKVHAGGGNLVTQVHAVSADALCERADRIERDEASHE